MKDKIRTYFLILPRWFALPAALTAIALGGLLAGGMTWQVWVSMVAGTIIMVGGHAYNSWADYFYGLDRGELASVGKWYTSGSQVISAKMTSLNKTLVYWVICYAISIVLIVLIALSIRSAWPLLGAGLGLSAATVYSPGPCKGLKHLGFPEYVGIVGFGIGGCTLGYASSSGAMSLLPVIAGLAVSLFWAAGWAVDQFPDAASDYQKGVRNLGTLIAVTDFPLALYFIPTVVLAYGFQIFVIGLGYLAPLTMLSLLAFPLFVLSGIWITTRQKEPQSAEFERGVKYGLAGIFIAMLFVVIGQAIGG